MLGRRKPRKRSKAAGDQPVSKRRGDGKQTGTYIHKSNAEWLHAELEGVLPFKIYPWRSVGTSFTRAFISDKAGGRQILRIIYWLEDRFPRFFGEEGKYPIIAFKKQTAP